MAVIPIYGKTLKIFLFRTKKALMLNLVIQRWELKSSNFVKIMILGWHLTFLYGMVKLVSQLLWQYLKKLHGICRYAIALFIRWANRGTWVFCYESVFVFFERSLLELDLKGMRTQSWKITWFVRYENVFILFEWSLLESKLKCLRT